MEEWFFFNRVNLLSHQQTCCQAVQRPPTVFPYPADAAFTFGDDATVATETATDRLLFQWFKKKCSVHDNHQSLARFVKVGISIPDCTVSIQPVDSRNLMESDMRRRSSVQISLVLIGGMLALGGCGGKDDRHVYKSKQDCLDDWGNDPKNCEEIKPRDRHYSHGFFYGPRFSMGRTYSGQGRRAIKTVSVSRGGFGSLSSFHSSFGG